VLRVGWLEREPLPDRVCRVCKQGDPDNLHSSDSDQDAAERRSRLRRRTTITATVRWFAPVSVLTIFVQDTRRVYRGCARSPTNWRCLRWRAGRSRRGRWCGLPQPPRVVALGGLRRRRPFRCVKRCLRRPRAGAVRGSRVRCRLMPGTTPSWPTVTPRAVPDRRRGECRAIPYCPRLL